MNARLQAIKTTIAVLCLMLYPSIHAAKNDSTRLRIVSYNIENLFDCQHDSLKDDYAFLEDGLYHWTESRYRKKLHNIAQVICNIDEATPPALIGLMEIENDKCLNDLCTYHLRNKFFPYKYIHYEGPDERGIDVALIYDSTRLSVRNHHPISLRRKNDNHQMRDILYVSFKFLDEYIGNTDTMQTLHCYVCHLPSQSGGSKAKDRRNYALQTLKQKTDSLLNDNPNAWIIVLGDFNDEPNNKLSPLINLMLKPITSDIGSYKYQGIWSMLDQFIVSKALLQHLGTPQIFSPEWLLEKDSRNTGYRPKRTNIGPRYNGGYSDHLPIYIDLQR